MDNAELYQGNNSLPKRDVLECLKQFADKIKWKKTGDRIIDIGCGDGSVTVNLLKEFIPENFEYLLGCDISEEMVAFANMQHKTERTSFTVLDIEGRFPEELRSYFNHAFSFFTFHWIQDQEKAFCNIFDLLVEGGQCLLLILGHSPLFDVYRILAKSNKWSCWLNGAEKAISPYNDTQNPEREVRKIMEKVGFTDIVVTCQEKSYVYDSAEAMKKALQAVNPFRMPQEVFDDYMIDYLNVIRDMKLKGHVNSDDHTRVMCNYTLIYAFGTK